MSYCHLCGIGTSALAYTFGGTYDNGDRSSTGSYIPYNTAFNTDPARVNVKMYDHVSSRGTCTTTDSAGPFVQCTTDADCDDNFACNGVETCNADGECVPGTPGEYLI